MGGPTRVPGGTPTRRWAQSLTQLTLAGATQHNPVAKLPLPKAQREEMRFLTGGEVLRLADAIDRRYRAFVLLVGFAGLRLGEMLGLRWGRVDLLRPQVQVAETLVDIEGHLHFGPPRRPPSVRNRSPVSSPTSSPPAWFRRRFWATAVRAAELAPLRIHDLRHAAVSLWIADGGRPETNRRLAGHTSVVVVLDRDGHLYTEQDDELMERLERRADRR